MADVQHLLKKKKKSLGIISPDATVYDAICLMAEKDIGALMVVDGENVVGMVTERDFIKKVLLHKKAPEMCLIRDVMIRQMVVVEPDYTVDACMSLMTDHHIRHLPVMKDGKLLGIVSIRDVVNHIVSEQEFMIMQLEDYIMACPAHLKPTNQKKNVVGISG